MLEQILNIFNSAAFPVACVIVCCYAIRCITKDYISYLRDSNFRLIDVIKENTELLKKLYDYLTRS